MKLVGPLNSGIAAGADGSATANQTNSVVVAGKVLSIYITYNDSPPAGSTDVVVATAGVSLPALTILTVTNAATSGWFHPRLQVHTTAGAAATLDGTRPMLEPAAIYDRIKVTISQANAGDNVDVWLLVDC